MYFTVGSLLPQYAASAWFAARPHLLLHDDAGGLVTTNYSGGCFVHRPGCVAVPVPCPWVDFSQPEAAAGWVAQLRQWVQNRSVDGIAVDGNPFDDEWISSVGGSPGILANVSSPAKRRAFLLGLNHSEAFLGQLIASHGGILMANGVHKPGDNGMLFEEWCGEHSYPRRLEGCDGSRSPIGCDMEVLQRYSAQGENVALVHIPDGSAGTTMSASGLFKLAAFLWAAGPRSFFADVPPLPEEKAHWQCDEWAVMPKFQELAKPLGAPSGPGIQPSARLYIRAFGKGAKVLVDLRKGGPEACVVWADGSRSATSASACAAA